MPWPMSVGRNQNKLSTHPIAGLAVLPSVKSINMVLVLYHTHTYSSNVLVENNSPPLATHENKIFSFCILHRKKMK